MAINTATDQYPNDSSTLEHVDLEAAYQVFIRVLLRQSESTNTQDSADIPSTQPSNQVKLNPLSIPRTI